MEGLHVTLTCLQCTALTMHGQRRGCRLTMVSDMKEAKVV